MLPRRSRRALAVAGVLLILAGLLLWQAGERLDAAIGDAVRLERGGALVGVTVAVTRLGGAVVLIPAALLAVVFLLVRRRMAAAGWLFATVASGRLLVEAAKTGVDRVRPTLDHHLVAVSSPSFPSSHSAGAMLTMLAVPLALGWPPAARLAAAAFALAVGCSRAMLGVHWPSDVLAGWGFALMWVAGAAWWRAPLPSSPRT